MGEVLELVRHLFLGTSWMKLLVEILEPTSHQEIGCPGGEPDRDQHEDDQARVPEALGQDERGRPRSLRRAAVGLFLALAAFSSVGEAPHRGWTVLEDHGRNVLASAEPDALILGNGDSRLFAMLYLQDVVGLRPDVVYVEPAMLGYPWYRERLNALHPELLPELEGKVHVPLEGLIARHYGQRPIYLAPRLLEDPALAAVLPAAYPYAAVYMRLVGPLEGLPPPEVVEEELRRALSRYTLRSRVVSEHEATATWESEAWDQYAITFSILADGYAAGGDEVGAERCRATARELSPWRFDPSLSGEEE